MQKSGDAKTRKGLGPFPALETRNVEDFVRVLLTRPEQAGKASGRLLEAQGFEPVYEPLTQVEPRHHPGGHLFGAQALILTSANGASALATRLKPGEKEYLENLPVYAVGPSTARAAQEKLGSKRVLCAGNGVTSLIDLIQKRADPRGGTLFYPTGEARAGNVQKVLAHDGYHVETVVLYACRAISHLRLETQVLLRQGHIDVVTLYSPRTAQIYASLAARLYVEAKRWPLHACLSPAVARALRRLGVRDTHIAIAHEPTQEALFSILLSLRREKESRVTERSKVEKPLEQKR